MSDLENTGWQDDFSVGFTEIDLHHKKLFLILHKFQEILELPDAEYKMQIGKVLKNLSEYAEYHFSEEEKLMTTYQYRTKNGANISAPHIPKASGKQKVNRKNPAPVCPSIFHYIVFCHNICRNAVCCTLSIFIKEILPISFSVSFSIIKSIFCLSAFLYAYETL